MHFRRALGERQHHEQRVFGNGGRIGGARHHQRDLAAAERRNVDGVEPDADPGHDQHVLGGFELGLAEAGAAEGDAMDRRMLLQLGVEIRLRDHVGKFDEFDVVSRVKQRSSLLRHRFRDEDFLLVGSHFLPLVSLLRRQRTTPVTSFSRCILLRSTANRSGPPSRAPALGLTRPQTCAPSSVK